MRELFGKHRVCGVVAAETSRGMIAQIRLGLRKTRTLELRLDYLQSAREREAFLSWLGRHRPRAVLIATFRRQEGGGLFQGSREDQLEILAGRPAPDATGATLKLKRPSTWRKASSRVSFLPRA